MKACAWPIISRAGPPKCNCSVPENSSTLLVRFVTVYLYFGNLLQLWAAPRACCSSKHFTILNCYQVLLCLGHLPVPILGIYCYCLPSPHPRSRIVWAVPCAQGRFCLPSFRRPFFSIVSTLSYVQSILTVLFWLFLQRSLYFHFLSYSCVSNSVPLDILVDLRKKYIFVEFN